MNSKDRILNRINRILKTINEAEAYMTAINLFEIIYGSNSEQLDALKTMYQQNNETKQSEVSRDWSAMDIIKGSLRALKTDIEEGLIKNIQSQARSEVLGDFLTLARESHDEGHKDVAAVLSSAALEDALKRCAKEWGLNVQGKNMMTVVNALKSNNIISKLQAKTLDGYTDFRNDALHADWDEIDSPTVISVIEFTDEFLEECQYANRQG